MQTVDDVGVTYTQLTRPAVHEKGLFNRLERRGMIIVLIVLALAFAVRAYDLDAAGLAEDETNKVYAIRSYEQGDFTVNADHPMLMKMLCFGSLHAVETWNRVVGTRIGLALSEEAALRLPNVLFGALTVVPLFLLTNALLGFRVGLITSVMWAVGLNAIWFNRIAKEDTLLVFFFLAGYYLYNLAKRHPLSDAAGKERLYALAGAAFGLMLASKYFLHYYGFLMLFYLLANYDSRNNLPLTRRMKVRHFGAMLLTFTLFNAAVFVPQTWRYLSRYVSEDLVTHHGYLIMDTLVPGDMGSTPNGSPWYFYLLYLGAKVPIPLLIAFLAGLVEIFRTRGEPGQRRGYLFLRVMLVFWLLPMSLLGSKFLRYTLGLMPFFYMTSAVGVVVIWRTLSAAARRLSGSDTAPVAQAVTGILVAAVFVLAPAVASVASLPHPSLYINAFGSKPAGYYFPHDEFYDVGARESIRYIADHAPRGAKVASDVPGVMQYYLERFGRTDIQSQIISHPKFSVAENRPDFVLLQRGRVYFENRDKLTLIKSTYALAQASRYRGAVASEVYVRTPLVVLRPARAVGIRQPRGPRLQPGESPFQPSTARPHNLPRDPRLQPGEFPFQPSTTRTHPPLEAPGFSRGSLHFNLRGPNGDSDVIHPSSKKLAFPREFNKMLL